MQSIQVAAAPLGRTIPTQHPSAEAEMPTDGADGSRCPAPCSRAPEGRVARRVLSPASGRRLAALQGGGAGTPPAGVRGPDQVCLSQPLLDQMGLSQWSSGQRTTTLPALGPHEDSGSAWEPQRWPGHSHCGDLPETGILIFPVTVRTLVLPVSR